MLIYNEQDTLLTEELFLALSPYAGSKPNFGLYCDDDEAHCSNPACGSTKLIADPARAYTSYAYTNVSKFKRWMCAECGNQMRERKRETPKKNMLVSLT